MKICTILARGGSQGVVGKNIRLLNGKPLITWSIEQAIRSKLFDYVVVSSDAQAILEVSKNAGVDLTITRPKELAEDHSPKIPALYHCVTEVETVTGLKFGQIVDLQPTSPLRIVEDIVAASKLQSETGSSSVITGTPSKCSPYFSLVEENADGTVSISKKLSTPVVRRQDSPKCFDMNGSIYVFCRDKFMRDQKLFFPDTKLYEMPEDRSVDIDTEFDFLLADYLLRHRNQ